MAALKPRAAEVRRYRLLALLQRGRCTMRFLSRTTKTAQAIIVGDFKALRAAGIRIRYQKVGGYWVYALGGR